MAIYWANNVGGGTGFTQGSPFRPIDFWPYALPGNSLKLLDGVYNGLPFMLQPTSGISGFGTDLITVSALNDGGVTIDGQGVRSPVKLFNNSLFVVEGLNACNGAAGTDAVIHNSGTSSNNIFRRICAWDNKIDWNNDIFGVHGGQNVLIEDCAGWGTARKIFQPSQGGVDGATFRRCWGRWEGSICVGPKVTFEGAYNAQNIRFENCISTWSGERMPDKYELMNNGVPQGIFFTNHTVEQVYALFECDAYGDGTHLSIVSHYGCIGYIRDTPLSSNYPPRVYICTGQDNKTIKDCVAYYQSGLGATRRGFLLTDLDRTTTGNTAVNLHATNLTSFYDGGVVNTIAPSWHLLNSAEAQTPSALYGPSEDLYNTKRGASVYYRYQDGILTSAPLWPWPMNDRIKQATVQSGRAQVDVQATIEAMFGSLAPVSPPDPPPPIAPSRRRGQGGYPMGSRLGIRR